jgi:glycosyltransferase involved in cell wall biosynthesis
MGKKAIMSRHASLKVTIMIPTYNQEDFIRDAVDSALMQTYSNLEIVVGDDASTDATPDIISKIKDPRLKLVFNRKNLGRTNNYRNILYNHATGDFVVNLDGDDYYTDPNFIADSVKLIDGDPRVVMVLARACWNMPGREEVYSDIPDVKEILGLDILKSLPQEKFYFKHMASLYRRETALKLDFYRSNAISSDWESLYRLALYGKVKYLDNNIGVWRIHGRNETASIDLDQFVENLGIWPSIYKEARKRGMNLVQAKNICSKCIVCFASKYLINLSSSGNKKQIQFLFCLCKYYPFSLVRLMFRPHDFARMIFVFFGYYRQR